MFLRSMNKIYINYLSRRSYKLFIQLAMYVYVLQMSTFLPTAASILYFFDKKMLWNIISFLLLCFQVMSSGCCTGYTIKVHLITFLCRSLLFSFSLWILVTLPFHWSYSFFPWPVFFRLIISYINVTFFL